MRRFAEQREGSYLDHTKHFQKSVHYLFIKSQILPKSFPNPVKSNQNPAQMPSRALVKTIPKTSMKKRTHKEPKRPQEAADLSQNLSQTLTNGAQDFQRSNFSTLFWPVFSLLYVCIDFWTVFHRFFVIL